MFPPRYAGPAKGAGRNGRGDLLAEVCGVPEGASEGDMGEPLARQAGTLCRRARAGPEAIPGWIAEGAGVRPTPGGGRSRAVSG